MTNIINVDHSSRTAKIISWIILGAYILTFIIIFCFVFKMSDNTVEDSPPAILIIDVLLAVCLARINSLALTLYQNTLRGSHIEFQLVDDFPALLYLFSITLGTLKWTYTSFSTSRTFIIILSIINIVSLPILFFLSSFSQLDPDILDRITSGGFSVLFFFVVAFIIANFLYRKHIEQDLYSRVGVVGIPDAEKKNMKIIGVFFLVCTLFRAIVLLADVFTTCTLNFDPEYGNCSLVTSYDYEVVIPFYYIFGEAVPAILLTVHSLLLIQPKPPVVVPPPVVVLPPPVG